MDKPVLSIGIIFKNDIRCIERCLKALQPLRDAVPCELVMADTGSDDGSREIAARYADILVDFPWINDFAAARNAVIDQCSGEWYLSVDTDEYLDEDCAELTRMLLADANPVNLYRVNIRSYNSYEMDGGYSDFYALRIFRMSLGFRYEGAIHEHLVSQENAGQAMTLAKVIFHHDGYVGMGTEAGRGKRKRNLSLIKKALEKDPENLLLRLQLVESSAGEDDLQAQIRRASALVRKKVEGWRYYGPAIFRYAATAAYELKMPEFRSWLKRAEEWFPDSYFIRIDAAYYALLNAWKEKEYDECIQRGEALREAYADFHAGRGDTDCQALSPLKAGTPYFEALMTVILACAYQESGRAEAAIPLLEELDYTCLDQAQINNLTKTICVIHSQSEEDTAPLITAAWKGINAPKPNQAKADMRKAILLAVASQTFLDAYRKEEAGKEKFRRPSYTLFLPLKDEFILGKAAAILESQDPAETEALLRGVKKWDELPYPALSHAIEIGVAFPLAERPVDIEDLDILAGRLAQEWDVLYRILRNAAGEDFAGSWQSLTWTRALALAAVQSCKWKDEEQGMELARIFARTEQAFITGCFAPEMLQEGNLCALPAMHRFGWYCVQAFDCLEAGDQTGYVRLLRAGLATHEGMKPMVEFLLDHTPELPPPSPELLELAEKVRVMLAACPPDDPSVMALKASPVYQKVAYLIEGGTQ